MANENEELELPQNPENADDSQDDSGESNEEVIKLGKKEYTRLTRKAYAYDEAKKNPANKTSSKDDTSEIKSQLARLELKTEGYSDESINFLQKVGGKEALKDPHVKAAIDSIQEQKRAEAAVIASESSKSEIEKKLTPGEIDSMSAEELYKVLPKARK